MKALSGLACLAAVAIAAVPALAGHSERIVWESDYARALARAQAEGKPVIVDFWADWCVPCHMMDLHVWPRHEVAAAAQRFVCVRVDADAATDLAHTYKLQGLPTIVIADPWGREITRKLGYTPTADLAPVLAACPGDFSAARPLVEALAKRPNDPEVLASLAGVYTEIGLFKLSNSFCEQALATASARKDPAFRQDMTLAVGLNLLRMRHFKEARESLAAFLRDFPQVGRADVAMLGLTTALLGCGEAHAAEKIARKMQAEYPDSPATKQAAGILAAARAGR